LVANYKGIRVFIPASHIELFHVDNLNQYKGNELEINIIEFKEERRTTKIVGSRRDLLKSKKSELEEITWSTLQAGDKVTGEVKRLTDFGAFVEVNGVDGLLHVSEISWGRIEKPSKVLKVGDKVEVYILEADKENKKLSLSLKRLVEDPWTNVEVKYPVGSVVLGKVARFAGFGAFIELEPGVDALVQISQISHKRIEKPQDALLVGQLIKAKIIDVNKETKKIGLSIKEVEEM
jgi:4-hydroxy-3-methylbut-2-enyl diphosphate reductase